MRDQLLGLAHPVIQGEIYWDHLGTVFNLLNRFHDINKTPQKRHDAVDATSEEAARLAKDERDRRLAAYGEIIRYRHMIGLCGNNVIADEVALTILDAIGQLILGVVAEADIYADAMSRLTKLREAWERLSDFDRRRGMCISSERRAMLSKGMR